MTRDEETAMWPTLQRTVLVPVLGLALSGCGEEVEPAEAARGVLTVGQALTADAGDAEVRGYVYVGADGAAHLCSGLAGSFPPQCGHPSIPVDGLDTGTLAGAETDQGVVWTGETTLRGALSGGVLTVG
jgi:hypothetical protein